MAPGLVSHECSTHRSEPSLSNSWMSRSATASRCALLAPTRWSMHAFLFLFPVSFRAGSGLLSFVQCLFSLGLPFSLSFRSLFSLAVPQSAPPTCLAITLLLLGPVRCGRPGAARATSRLCCLLSSRALSGSRLFQSALPTLRSRFVGCLGPLDTAF